MRERVEDGLNSTPVAVVGGIFEAGGVALVPRMQALDGIEACADEKYGIKAPRRALGNPALAQLDCLFRLDILITILRSSEQSIASSLIGLLMSREPK